MQLLLAAILAMHAAAGTPAQTGECYSAHGSKPNAQPCNDGNPLTSGDQCYDGFCGGWMQVSAVIASELEREQWLCSDPTLGPCGGKANRKKYCPPQTAYGLTTMDPGTGQLFYKSGNAKFGCYVKEGPKDIKLSSAWPMYLSLDSGHGHGYAMTNDAVHSYVAWRQRYSTPNGGVGTCAACAGGGCTCLSKGQPGYVDPDIKWSKWKPGAQKITTDSNGLLSGACPAGVNCPIIKHKGGRVLFKAGPWLRSESQGCKVGVGCNAKLNMVGYKTVQIFVEKASVPITNVQTISCSGGLVVGKTCTSNKYSVQAVHPGDKMYSDRDYAIKSLPAFLTGLHGIQTPNNDKHSVAASKTWLRFTIPHRAVVYVLYDARNTGAIPAWLKNRFTNENLAAPGIYCCQKNKAGVIDQSNAANKFYQYEIYYATFEAGVVSLGGNDSPGVGSMYTVMVGPMVDLSQHPTHRVKISLVKTTGRAANAQPYKVMQIGSGDKYYSDRPYTLGKLPPFLFGLNAIQTSNNDKRSDGRNRNFLCFTVAERSRVFILYDRRAKIKPDWLTDQFVDQHEDAAEQTDANMKQGFQVYSGLFGGTPGAPTGGQVCLGGNDACGKNANGQQKCKSSGVGSMYLVFVAPNEWKPYVGESEPATSRYFDGDNDYVKLPGMGSFNVITIDTWVKFFSVSGNHPIMNEDNWNSGDVHYQIYSSQFGFDVHPASAGQQGDFTFTWQPTANQWTRITVLYSSVSSIIQLYINGAIQETASKANGKFKGGPPITLDSPRLGAWVQGNRVARSMHGEIALFRIWRGSQAVNSGAAFGCPAAGTPTLVASYIFGEATNKLRDLSGNARDGLVHDATWSNDRPANQQCTLQGFGGYFDGAADSVKLPNLGTFPQLTVATWLKFFKVTGNHPVMNNDGWSRGNLHYQIYSSKFGFDVNGVGDATFKKFQPRAHQWYFISVSYDSTIGRIVLFVNNRYVEAIVKNDGGKPLAKIPILLNSPRIGAWKAGNGIARSMHGDINSLRIWRIVTNGLDSCPDAGTKGLVANYMFGEASKILKDLSGNGKDGTIVDASYSTDSPPGAACVLKSQITTIKQRCPKGTLCRTSDIGKEQVCPAAGGAMTLTSPDIEMATITNLNNLGKPAGCDQVVGMRFKMNIPQGAKVTAAKIRFAVDTTNSDKVTLYISVQSTDDAQAISSRRRDLSSRSRSNRRVAWTPAPWTVIHNIKYSADVAPILQEIVCRKGWQSGNSVLFLIGRSSGSGIRTAQSDLGGTPSISYSVVPSTNAPGTRWQACLPPPKMGLAAANGGGGGGSGSGWLIVFLLVALGSWMYIKVKKSGALCNLTVAPEAHTASIYGESADGDVAGGFKIAGTMLQQPVASDAVMTEIKV